MHKVQTYDKNGVVSLPITPFHYPVAYVLYKLGGKLSLPALIVGSMLPDLEIPFMVLLFGTAVPTHLLLHSLIGSLTIGTLLATAITVFIYPKLTSAIFPIDKIKVKEKCRFSINLLFSCAIGCLFHVLLDVTNHSYNPVLWPFLAPAETPSPIVSFLGGAATASLLIHALMIVLFICFFACKFLNSWEHVLVE
ncbi:DUF4184 family protein [Candidatus Bathyarchaeota archaeon]|nr:DUF4184 family protein [Candidatus Bathyarchaeota archaeon]